MSVVVDDEHRINVSIPINVLASLFSAQHLCAADLLSLDSESHASLRCLMLSMCAQNLKGFAKQCQGCASQGYCQQVSNLNVLERGCASSPSSVRLH